jgi:hypothetical protein
MRGLNIRTVLLGVVCSALLSPILIDGTAVAAVSHHHPRHHAVHRSHHTQRHSSIPQHNGGDGDPDNNGAATDGDGNI